MESALNVEKCAQTMRPLFEMLSLDSGCHTLDLGLLCSLPEPENGALSAERIFFIEQQEKIVYLEQLRKFDVWM